MNVDAAYRQAATYANAINDQPRWSSYTWNIDIDTGTGNDRQIAGNHDASCAETKRMRLDFGNFDATGHENARLPDLEINNYDLLSQLQDGGVDFSGEFPISNNAVSMDTFPVTEKEMTSNNSIMHPHCIPKAYGDDEHGSHLVYSQLNGEKYGNTSPYISNSPLESLEDNFRFQYVLCAPTAIAMKRNEETLTYLNQGQSYQIKLKKLGDLSFSKGKVFKSRIRLLFHDRRLQRTEQQHMSLWQAARPGDRLFQLDAPSSYGIFDCYEHPKLINVVEFLWVPTKEVGVFIMVNCVSTEFTAKKHGGEKGVSFRLQIETYSHSKHVEQSLHIGSCQIKIFKLKGADRKHKQDREKISRKPISEQEKFQHPYDCTIFIDAILRPDEGLILQNDGCMLGDSSNMDTEITNTANGGEYGSGIRKEMNGIKNGYNAEDLASLTITKNMPLAAFHHWLRSNRFSMYFPLFKNFSACDMLSLSRDDLIQLCGTPDGIRLYNCLSISPRLTIYVKFADNSNVFNPIYLKLRTCQELIWKIAPLMGYSISSVRNTYIIGPYGSRIVITDDLVENMKEGSFYSAEMIASDNNGTYKILLRPIVMDSAI